MANRRICSLASRTRSLSSASCTLSGGTSTCHRAWGCGVKNRNNCSPESLLVIAPKPSSESRLASSSAGSASSNDTNGNIPLHRKGTAGCAYLLSRFAGLRDFRGTPRRFRGWCGWFVSSEEHGEQTLDAGEKPRSTGDDTAGLLRYFGLQIADCGLGGRAGNCGMEWNDIACRRQPGGGRCGGNGQCGLGAVSACLRWAGLRGVWVTANVPERDG